MAIPTITTQAGSSITFSGFTANGTIVSTGGANATRRGVCYKAGTTGDPTIADLSFYTDGDFGTGAFTTAVSGLSPYTGYRVREFATNPSGVGYGDTVQVTTLATGQYAYTLTNLLVTSREILQEATASFWTDAVLTNYANNAISQIVRDTGCYRVIKSADTVALQRTVSFTGYKCIAIEYNKKALIKITPLQVGSCKIDGITPQFWYEYGNYVCIEPVPAEIYTLSLYVVETPNVLVSASDYSLIPYSLCGLIPFYVAAKALEQDLKYDAAAELMSIFNNDLDFMSKALLPNLPDGEQDVRFK